MKFGKFLRIALLILLAAGAQPAYSAFWQWSKTAATNATADPSINWAEGMSPSSVNDSARAMMARSAEWRDDIGGALVLGGTATAYTVTTNEGLASPPNDGQLLAFRATATNGVGVTLAADGGTAYPINIDGSTAVPAASILQGSTYRVTFNLASLTWRLNNLFGNPYSVPLGGLLPYTLTTSPNSNFVFPAGQCLSTTTYAAYWVALGSPASGTCPGGQFRIIDLSGRVPAGLDTMPGFGAAGRLSSNTPGCGTAITSVGAVCANGSEARALSLAQLPIGITSNGVNAISVASNSSTYPAGQVVISIPSTGGAQLSLGGGSVNNNIASSGSNAISVTSNNTSGASFTNVQPTIGVTYLLRVI